jgi:DNA adenine methylase
MRHYYLSPLRYPGGKAALAPFLAELMAEQRPRANTYIEPFAGGGGAALRLLYGEYVDRIVLNDLNPGIAAFWRSVFWHTDELIELILRCELSVSAWRLYHEQYMSAACSELELGFATLYLNRTNRSGILDARPIGGMNQAGKWKIGVRFNRESLIDRVRILGSYRDRVEIMQHDALELLQGIDTKRVFLYVDPPYLTQGDELYLNTLSWEDHERLAKILRDRHRQWILTYDVDSRIPGMLYRDLRCAEFSIKHTAAIQQMGNEYAVFSPRLVVNSIDKLSRGYAEWITGQAPAPENAVGQATEPAE